jgi:transcriptional regulator with XRE-family HTH domain
MGKRGDNAKKRGAMSKSDTIEAATSAETQLPDQDDQRLGSCLRALRKERALSIQMLADRCGLSIGMLSQIERGLSTPSIRSLRLLSIALDVPVSWFFMQSDAAAPGGSRYILRKAARSSLRLTPTGVRKESLTPAGDGALELYEATLAPGGTSGPEFYSHGGEKAGLVTLGTLRLWLEEEPHLLGEGDSFRFPSKISHRFDNPTGDYTSVLWIVSARLT